MPSYGSKNVAVEPEEQAKVILPPNANNDSVVMADVNEASVITQIVIPAQDTQAEAILSIKANVPEVGSDIENTVDISDLLRKAIHNTEVDEKYNGANEIYDLCL